MADNTPKDFYICKMCRGGKLIHVHSEEQMDDEQTIVTFCPICDLPCLQCYNFSSRRHP